MAKIGQNEVLQVVDEKCGWRPKLHLHTATKRLGEKFCAWSHQKDIEKCFQNLMNFNQIGSKTALQYYLKVQ